MDASLTGDWQPTFQSPKKTGSPQWGQNALRTLLTLCFPFFFIKCLRSRACSADPYRCFICRKCSAVCVIFIHSEHFDNPMSGYLESITPCKNLFFFTFELTSVSYLKGIQDAKILTWKPRHAGSCSENGKLGLIGRWLPEKRAREIDLGGARSCRKPSGLG